MNYIISLSYGEDVIVGAQFGTRFLQNNEHTDRTDNKCLHQPHPPLHMPYEQRYNYLKTDNYYKSSLATAVGCRDAGAFGPPLGPSPDDLRPALEAEEVVALHAAADFDDCGEGPQHAVPLTLPPVLQSYAGQLVALHDRGGGALQMEKNPSLGQLLRWRGRFFNDLDREEPRISSRTWKVNGDVRC